MERLKKNVVSGLGARDGYEAGITAIFLSSHISDQDNLYSWTATSGSIVFVDQKFQKGARKP